MAVTRPVDRVRDEAPDDGGARSPAAPGARWPGLLPDVALAAALTAVAQLDLRLDFDNSTRFGPTWAVVLCSLVATAALTFRRRAPLATMLVVAAAVAGPEVATLLTFSLWGHFAPLLVAAYSVARYADRRSADAGLVVAVAVLVVLLVRVPSLGTPANIPFAFVPLAVVTAVGRGLRRRELSHAVLALEAGRLAEDRATWVREAVAVERARIARELHDVVAHCVSVMVIQAGAAEDLLDRDPQAAREPLREVQATGQEAVAELGHLLGLLRGDAQPDDRRPQPGVAQLPELVAQVREAGLAAGFEIEGRAHDLPPGIDVTLYRLAQEALTNVLKHARGARATVVLRYGEEAVALSVHDDGGSSSVGRDRPPGHGLIGMRERVALFGGTLAAGPREGRGWAVDAVLPLGPVPLVQPA